MHTFQIFFLIFTRFFRHLKPRFLSRKRYGLKRVVARMKTRFGTPFFLTRVVIRAKYIYDIRVAEFY